MQLADHAFRLILTAASALFAVCGIAALFASEELASWGAAPLSPLGSVALQVVGGALLGFALLNGFNRNTRVGGIYGRPIGLANLMLSGVVATSVGRAALDGLLPIGALVIAAPFGAIALGFAWLVFGLSEKSL